MLDANWDLINGPDAHHIEILNYTNQVNVIEALFHFLICQCGQDESGGCIGYPALYPLRALHHAGTLFLLERPGDFRDTEVHVALADGTVIHAPPPAAEVAGLMEAFDRDLGAMWAGSDGLEIAAFTLWKINWIHPFKNGNGRTARAFAYACLCLKYGMMLPGQTSVIDLIMANRPAFQAALAAADASFAAGGEVDLSLMRDFLAGLLVQQLQSIPQTEQA